MYGIYANIGGILMVNVTIYGIHGSYDCVRDLITGSLASTHAEFSQTLSGLQMKGDDPEPWWMFGGCFLSGNHSSSFISIL